MKTVQCCALVGGSAAWCALVGASWLVFGVDGGGRQFSKFNLDIYHLQHSIAVLPALGKVEEVPNAP